MDEYATFSPRSDKVTFSSDRFSGTFAIWIMDSDGARATRLTYMAGKQTCPKFNAAGDTIAFLSDEGKGATRIYTIKVSGGSPVNLVEGSGIIGSFAWSPDGESIAYDTYVNRTWSIWLVDTSNGRKEQPAVNEGANSRDPSWGTNSTRLFFSSDHGSPNQLKIWSVDLETGGLVKLTSGPGNDTRPSVSPNGAYIAFVSDRGGQPFLFLMNSDGTNVHQAVSDPQTQTPGISWTPNVSEASSPLWNSQSQGILFQSDATFASGSMTSNIYVYYRDITVLGYAGSRAVPKHVTLIGSSIIPGALGTGKQSSPSWDANGTEIVYSMAGPGGCSLWARMLVAPVPKPSYGV